MLKRIIILFVLVCYVMQISACTGAIRKKFIRKKTLGQNRDEVVFQPEDYSKEFTNKQLYANHFAFWKSAESELINSIKNKSSRKKQELYLSYTKKEMDKLRGLINEKKQKEMMLLIDELAQISEKIIDITYFSSHRLGIIKQLQRHYKLFRNSFAYNKVKDSINIDEQ